MLHYQRIELYERVDIDKARGSKEGDICHYWFFWIKDLSFNHIYAIAVTIY